MYKQTPLKPLLVYVSATEVEISGSVWKKKKSP